jgi:squalene-hopene/tetraprenyl-beta-curcumene cyclase
LSNLQLMLQGLKDSGVSSNDEVFHRALTFLARTQMHGSVNDMPYAEGSEQGGFIYSTGPSGDEMTVGESKAGTIEESLDDGTRVSRLRCYGSMTYAGFKSYIYADLGRDDERVRMAYDWLRAHYTLEENPGLGMQGFYYYMVTFSRALDAWGLPTIETIDENGSVTGERDWANDLIDRLAGLQKEDGSFENLHDRWLEGDPTLVTAYALVALQHAVR